MLNHIEVKHCPLCAANDYINAPPAFANLYSEQLALITQSTEAEIIALLRNVQCQHCKLIYKKNWLPERYWKTLFATAVASHPRGWDVRAQRFNHHNFLLETKLFSQAIAEQNNAEIARYQRALSAIVDSIARPEFSDTQKAAVLSAIKAQQADALVDLIQPLQTLGFGEPAAFKRFSGFSAPALWQWLQMQLGSIQSLGEVGCPLWGFLARADITLDKRVFLLREEVNYWGKACQQNGQHCLSMLHGQAVQTRAWWPIQAHEPRLDLLAAFQYLDHVLDPLTFVQQALQQAENVLLVVDQVRPSLAVQHYTGWCEQSVAFLLDQLHLSGQFGTIACNSAFEPIKASGNDLYLLQRRYA